MSKKSRFLSFFLAIVMLLSSLPVVPVCAQEETEVSGLTVPFRSDVPFEVDGNTVTSNSYRIPAMVTLSDGTIVAAADIRWNTTFDGGGLDNLVAKSTDGGKTWSYNASNYLGDNGNKYNGSASTAFLDPSLVVGADGQTVYMLVDLYPYGVALNGKNHTQPSEKVGFNKGGYLLLSGDNHKSYSYYLKEGKIYNSANTPVEGYEVDAYFNISGPNGINTNLFCEDSPYKVVRTGYLYLTSSKDGGSTWSEPTLLNVKTSSERVCLVAPGSSITTSSGTMIFPVYSYHGDNDASGNTQRLSFIYSNDGENWSRSSEFNYNWASEAAVVELTNGSLRFFFRNGTKKLNYVDYHMGNGWGSVVTLSDVNTNSNTQISAITYSKTSNGKQVVLVSCPTGPNRKGSNSSKASNRLNGSIFVFTVESNGDMNLEKTIYVNEKDNQFIYSCLSERSDGAVLVLFENKENEWGVGDNCFYTMDIKGYLPSALGIKLDKPETIIVDENGNIVNSVKLGLYEKTELQAKVLHNSSADIHYQWQIEYESGKWMDIYGENGKAIELSFGMVGTLLGSDGKVNIRCKTSDAINVVCSSPIPVTIAMYQPEEPEIEVSESFTTSTGETVKVSVAGIIPEEASVQLSETDSSGIEVGSGETVAMALDISIKNADGSEWQPASGETVTVTLEASKIGLQNGDQVVVYHLHEGTVKVLGSFAVANNTISFDVDGFSKFVFAVTEDDTPLANDDKVTVTLTAKKEDGTIILQEPYELEYNGAVSQKVEIPYLKGYDLYEANGTVLTPDLTKNVYVYTVNKTDVTQNLEIELTYKPGKTTYKVTYFLQNVLDEEYTQYGDSVILEGITGAMVDVSNEAFSKSFVGFYQLLFETAEIASDGSTNIEIYYDRLYYKMLFDLDGGYGVQPVYARYGTPVSVDNPIKAGYIFVGWDSNKGWTEDFVTGEVNEWDLDTDTSADIEQFMNIPIPANHTSYTAIWRANDAAKVTVVVWGQNADNDGYSYVSEEAFEIYANTGSTITYVPGQLMCGFEVHTHGSGCSSTCGETEHVHSVADGCYDRICGKDEHTEHTDSCWNCGGIRNHTIACYESSRGTLNTTPVDDATKFNITNNSTITSGGLYRIGRYSYTYYYKLGNDYYQVNSTGSWWNSSSPDDDTTVELKNSNCHTNLHAEHNSSCAMTCEEHTHSDACYKLKCQTTEHSHSAACYSCGKKAHTHDASCRHTTNYDDNPLWTLNQGKTGYVTVSADGTTTLNVYYDRTTFTVKFMSNGGGTTYATVTKKWGANIRTEFIDASTDAGSYMWSRNKDASKSPWTSFLAVMPQENRDYYAYVYSSNNTYKATYYGLKLGGTPGVESDYEVLFPIEFKYRTGLTVSEEEFENIEGYTLNKAMSAETGDSYNGAEFFYDRNSYNLVFDNYGTTVRNEIISYEAPMSSYGSYSLDASKAPSVYQPGSVTFKGWYLAPQTPNDFNFDNVKPYDFANSTMPANDLILYAWWEPINHDVTFYHSYEDLEAGKIYSVDEITYDYDVPHGSIIQSPFTPPADPTNGKYDFLGWFYINENGIETLWDFKNTTVTSDVKIYAKWTSNILMNYTVKFVYKDGNGNEIEIADPITGSALAGNTKTFEAKVGSALKAGYQTRYFPEIQSHSLTVDIEDETKNVYTFYYVYREYVPYQVYYLTKNNPGTSLGTTTYKGEIYYLIAKTKTVEKNEKAIVTENAVMISGYVFDEYQKRLYIDPNNTRNAIYFIYEKDNVNGQYVVHYMTEKADGSGFDEHSSFTGKMSSGSVYSVPNPPKEIQHFTWAKGHAGEVMSGTVTAGNVLELWVYYTRNEYSYKVQYLDQVTGLPVLAEKNGTAKWEAQVTEKAVDVNGYELLGNKTYTLTISDNSLENVITFYYVKDVTIKYQVVGPTGCGSVDAPAETIGASTGKANGSTATASSNVYKFVGWYLDADCKNAVPEEWVSENRIKPQKPGEFWVNVTYYAKFEYNLTSLTIDKVFPDGADYSMDINQSFLFDIVEVDESGNVVSNGVNLTVTIHKDGSIKIDGMTVGHRYKITEKTDWSWRYGKCAPSSNLAGSKVSGNSITVKLSADAAANKVTFTNERTYKYWLDGDDYNVNIFKKKDK